MSGSEKNVAVYVSNFEEFFKERATYPLAIDTYQRPYVWNVEKVKELLADFQEHLATKAETPYYMGSILLHENEEEGKLFIIDGQQRMTTLSILYYLLHGKLVNDKMAMKFNSPISIKNIKSIQAYLDNQQWKEKVAQLFPNIQFTYIITPSEDLAFTFFDTQNYRGVKLKPTDLLKAYHLRSIHDVTIQERCAKDWETIQRYPPILSREGDFSVELFNKYLWRARSWKGQNEIGIESDEDLLHAFMKKTIPSESDNTVNLFPSNNNTYGLKLYVNEDGYGVHIQHETLQNELHLPFIIRQPISKGVGYFLFAKKYAKVAQVLFVDETNKRKEIQRFRAFYEHVWKHTSIYLRELFILASIMYYDKFGEREFFRFSLWLDHVLGAIRLQKQNVVKQAPLKFLMEEQNNLLDMISHAFLPEEVFEFLFTCSEHMTIYQTEEVEMGKGVQGSYKERVLTYYKKDNFQQKETWMDQLAEEVNNGH